MPASPPAYSSPCMAASTSYPSVYQKKFAKTYWKNSKEQLQKGRRTITNNAKKGEISIDFQKEHRVLFRWHIAQCQLPSQAIEEVILLSALLSVFFQSSRTLSRRISTRLPLFLMLKRSSEVIPKAKLILSQSAPLTAAQALNRWSDTSSLSAGNSPKTKK